MTELNPQERFQQLLAFLKEPEAQPHPTLHLDIPIWLEGRRHSAAMVRDVRQEAIEIMESGMFEDGCLKGNRKTPDIPVNRLEKFVLQAAAAVRLAKWHRDNSPEFRFADCGRRPRTFEKIQKGCFDMMSAFDVAARMMIEHRLIRPDRLAHLRGDLFKVKAKALAKIKEEMDFDLVNELIRIFIVNIPQAPNSLIAGHITDFVNNRRELLQNDLLSLWQDTIRKEVEKLRKQAFIAPTI